MARNRSISPDFWTWEAVIDCGAMTRLLFIGLQNFADDGGVQPLRPRTIRMQVFPGDEIGNDQVRAMIDELAARGLVRIYEVEGLEYVSIVDWDQLQRVGKRARRRYPADPSRPVTPEQAPEPAPMPAADEPAAPPLVARWRKTIGAALRRALPNGPPADTEACIDRWIAEGCDLERDVLPAIGVTCRPAADRDPPTDLREVAAAVEANRARRVAAWIPPIQAAA